MKRLFKSIVSDLLIDVESFFARIKFVMKINKFYTISVSYAFNGKTAAFG